MIVTTWTLAYRNPRANRFQRVTNWSGTWHQAYYLAAKLMEAQPALQVYYVQTQRSEQEQAARMNQEVRLGRMDVALASEYLADHGNILVAETKRRVRVFETGSLSDEVLAQVMDPQAARERYEDNGRPARYLA